MRDRPMGPTDINARLINDQMNDAPLGYLSATQDVKLDHAKHMVYTEWASQVSTIPNRHAAFSHLQEMPCLLYTSRTSQCE